MDLLFCTMFCIMGLAWLYGTDYFEREFENLGKAFHPSYILFYEKALKMAEIYKAIHPVKYFNDFISQNIRPDGREFSELRHIKLSVNCANTADASAIAKIGNTTVVCGIQLELAKPKAEEPEAGFLITNVEIPPLCSPKFRPGPPSDHAQVTSNILSDMIINSKCIDLKDLCIVTDKLAWVLHCDLICLDNDGSIIDACIIALLASLKSLQLPHVTFDVETEEISVDINHKTNITIHGLPVATSFSIYNSEVMLTDPCAYEEELCGSFGANLIICFNKDMLCSVQKLGGGHLSNEFQEKAFKIAKERTTLIEKVVNTSLNIYNT